MNSTSRGCRLVSSAARSPARAITGPEVARKPTPSSRATICASVVLPRPGGPYSSTWSSASPRPRAAAMNTRRFWHTRSWPTKSARRSGRSASSTPSPASRPRPADRRRFRRSAPCLSAPSHAAAPSRARPPRISASSAASAPMLARGLDHRAKGLGPAVAEVDQRRNRVRHSRASRHHRQPPAGCRSPALAPRHAVPGHPPCP